MANPYKNKGINPKTGMPYATLKNDITFMTLGLVGMAMTAMTPALATFGAHFEGKNVTWFQTLTTLGVIFGSLLVGQIMGKRVSIKTLAVLGNVLCLVFGFLPMLFDNYAATMVCRFAFGFALGLLVPLGNALLIMYHEEGRHRNILLGLGTTMMSLGGILFQMLGGIFAAMNWQLTFMAHIVFIISLVGSIMFPNMKKTPGQVEQQAENNEALNEFTEEEEKTMGATPASQQVNPVGPDGQKLRVGKQIWLSGVLVLLFNMCNMPMMMNASVLFEIRDAGGAVVAATALTCYTILGMVAGVAFGPFFTRAKRWVFPFSYGICAVGALIIYFGQTALVMGTGMAIIGFGFNLATPTLMALVGLCTHPALVGKASSYVMIFINFGGFLGSPWLILLARIFGESIFSALIADFICCAVIAIIYIFYNPFKGLLPGRNDPPPVPPEEKAPAEA